VDNALHMRKTKAAAVIMSATVALAACSNGSSGRSSSGSASATTAARAASTTLRVAFVDDMGPPDPDTFYGSEGLMVTTSVYEGLLQYANNSTTIVGALADIPSVSSDGLTYTFKLHHGVKFHDGTPFNAAAVKFSFARRTAVNQGPAYMLGHLKAVDAPDPLTVVVHLDKPVSAFLDYLASPFGPKMVSPTAITANASGNDQTQKWLQTHDVGTGPFQITSFVPSQNYVLSRFAGYWGHVPGFSEVDISIQPSLATQQLELEGGQLDMIMHGLTPQDIDALSKKNGFAVHQYPTELKGILFVNPHSGPFATVAARDALGQALDKNAITSSVYGAAGTVSTQIFPAGELPASATTSTVTYDPAVLKSLVPTLPTKKVDIGFDPTDPRNQKLADLVQIALQSAGMNASTRQIPISQIFDLPNHLGQAPSILIQTTNPDAAHPDTWARIYMSKGGGANYLQCVDPAVDTLLDTGLSATTPDAVNAAYGQAGNMLVKGGCFIDIADVQDTIVTRTGLTGFYHVPSIPWSYNLDSLTNG
jgi:peptide/nickel transport system substrate-binding protein